VILIDSSGLLAVIDAAQSGHNAAVGALLAAVPPRCLSPFVLAELDYMVSTRVSRAAANRLLAEVGNGVYQLEPFTTTDIQRAMEILDSFHDLDVGLTDASVVVLAERYGVRDVLTLDERHFRTLRDSSGKPFRILPADLAA
jgi:predicted nucleic acid-binding protein